MNPKIEATAYRIWCYAESVGWNCTAAQIAEEIDVPTPTVANICFRRKWNNRLRVDSSAAINLARQVNMRSHTAGEVRAQIIDMRTRAPWGDDEE